MRQTLMRAARPGVRLPTQRLASTAAQPPKPRLHEKHVAVDTTDPANLVARPVSPLPELPRANLLAHILQQYKRDSGEFVHPLPAWQKLLGDRVITAFNLDMDRIRAGPVAGAIYRNQCKQQAYFERGVALSPTAAFYFERLGLPQTFFQWYQIEVLHIWMLYVRMRAMPRKYGREYQQKLVNGVFDDIDYQLREVLRVDSDRTVNNYKKQFSQQLRGSVFSYDEALLGGDTVLASALWRNLYAQSAAVELTVLAHLVQYVRANLYVLARMSDVDFASGLFKFLDVRFQYEPLQPDQTRALEELVESTRSGTESPGSRTTLSNDGW